MFFAGGVKKELEKPKIIWYNIIVWIIVIILLLIHIICSYFGIFIVGQIDLKSTLETGLHYGYHLGFFIASLIILYLIFNVKKFSWFAINILSIAILTFYSRFFFIQVGNIVFLSSYSSSEYFYSIPHVIARSIVNLIFPFVIFAMLLLVNKPDSKKYYNQI